MEIVLNGRAAAEKSVIALGMFDGVHIGHRVLLERAAFLAREAGCPLVVCTFQQHPMELLNPAKNPKLLTTMEERQQLIASIGADVFFALPFDREAAETLPEVYVGQLVRQFHPTAVVCGYNHTFGKNAAGSPALLEVLGGALGFQTSIVPAITLRGQDVSSSAIRQSLEAGDVRKAMEMLGRPYSRAAQADESGVLHFPEDNKQPVGDGLYRGAICAGGKRFPAMLRQHDGLCQGRLPRQMTGAEVRVEYLGRA